MPRLSPEEVETLCRTFSLRETYSLGPEEVVSESEKPPNHSVILASVHEDTLPAYQPGSRAHHYTEGDSQTVLFPFSLPLC